MNSLKSFLADGAEDGADIITLQLFVGPVYHKDKIAAQSNHNKSAKTQIIFYVQPSHFRIDVQELSRRASI